MTSKTTSPVTGPPSGGGGRSPAVGEHGPREADRRDRARRVGAMLAGPALIVVSVLVVQHRFAFGGMVTNQHPDILAMWLPTHCFLGRSLASGHIPAWNPHLLGGTPFAADPQSGWLYLPAMVLYTALPCGTALRWFIVFQPLLAGLGMYGFLRSERLARVAATCGGVVMGLLVGGSYLAVQLPFGGALAWTTVLLAAASRFVRTTRGWPARLGWALAAAVAWGQLASAHLSNGLVVGTFALVVYAAVALGQEVRGGRMSWRQAVLLAAILLAALPMVNLAILLPRLVYLRRTTSALGYGELARRAAALAGHPVPPTPVGVTSRATWPLTLIGPIGGYAGSVALALALGGWRRSRALFLGFLFFAGVCYLLSLEAVARALGHVLGGSTVGDFYLHVPSRFSDGVVLALPVLVAFGAAAWLRPDSGWRNRLLVLAPGVVVWWVIGPLVGVVHHDAWLPLAGGVVGAAVLVGAVRRPAVMMALPLLLAVELAANGLAGQSPRYSLHGAVEVPAAQLSIPPLRRPLPARGSHRPGPRPDARRPVRLDPAARPPGAHPVPAAEVLAAARQPAGRPVRAGGHRRGEPGPVRAALVVRSSHPEAADLLQRVVLPAAVAARRGPPAGVRGHHRRRNGVQEEEGGGRRPASGRGGGGRAVPARCGGAQGECDRGVAGGRGAGRGPACGDRARVRSGANRRARARSRPEAAVGAGRRERHLSGHGSAVRRGGRDLEGPRRRPRPNQLRPELAGRRGRSRRARAGGRLRGSGGGCPPGAPRDRIDLRRQVGRPRAAGLGGRRRRHRTGGGRPAPRRQGPAATEEASGPGRPVTVGRETGATA